MRRGEGAQAMPLAIMALTIGTLVVPPFLGHASASLISARVYGEVIARQAASDARSEERRGGEGCRSRWSPYH